MTFTNQQLLACMGTAFRRIGVRDRNETSQDET